ncbi:MAG: hypothetical protein AB1705_03005 [Verrucomicrobiota bacterium]
MKTKTGIVGLLVLTVALTLAALHYAQAQADTREVMKLKLGHSQKVLEGIAKEDFQVIGDSAHNLVQLSQAMGWRARQTPEYELFTTEFRRHARSLERAAEQRNLDAATGAYMQMTVACVSCHKYMRAKNVASLR